jgi:hypothetical protein
VIDPRVAFTLNTKNHLGSKVWLAENALLVNGHRTDYLRNSRFQAKRATKLLSAACGSEMPVDPIIVLMADGLTVRG